IATITVPSPTPTAPSSDFTERWDNLANAWFWISTFHRSPPRPTGSDLGRQTKNGRQLARRAGHPDRPRSEPPAQAVQFTCSPLARSVISLSIAQNQSKLEPPVSVSAAPS